MTTIDINAGGLKKDVIHQITADKELSSAQAGSLMQLVAALPGTHVSVSGDLRHDQEGLSGSLELRVSFWTEKPKSK